MTTEQTSTRELDEDERRRQVLVQRRVRKYLREVSNEEDNTYSEQLGEWLPENPDVEHRRDDDDIVNIKVVPDIHARIDDLAGHRVSPGDVVAYYALLDAVERGDLRVAAELSERIPDLLWDIFEFDSQSIADGSRQ